MEEGVVCSCYLQGLRSIFSTCRFAAPRTVRANAQAQRRHADWLDHFAGYGDSCDGSHSKALHIRVDRTAVNGHVHETKCSGCIGYFGPRRSLRGTRQRNPNAFAWKRVSVGGR
jgi:hypothetical protein